MDDAVGDEDVGDQDPGAVDEDGAVVDGNGQIGTSEGRHLLAVLQEGRIGYCAIDDYIELGSTNL